MESAATAPAAPPTPAQIRALLDASAALYYKNASADQAVLVRGYAVSGEAVALVGLLANFKPAFDAVFGELRNGNIGPLRALVEGMKDALGINMSGDFADSARLAADVLAATGVPCYWVVAPGVPHDAPVIFSVHGGARVFGTAEPAKNAEIYRDEAVSRMANARVLTVDFSNAPDATGSQQVAQCLKVYQWVLNDLHVPARKVAWMGGSGGGSLALSVVLAIAARKLPTPAGAYIASPMTSAHPLPSILENRNADAFVGWSADVWETFYKFLSGSGTAHALPLTHPDVSPLYGDYKGVCPLYISCTKAEVLYDDTVAVIRKARASGVPVKATVASGLFHCWAGFASWVPEAREELAIASRWLAEHLHPGFADID